MTTSEICIAWCFLVVGLGGIGPGASKRTGMHKRITQLLWGLKGSFAKDATIDGSFAKHEASTDICLKQQPPTNYGVTSGDNHSGEDSKYPEP